MSFTCVTLVLTPLDSETGWAGDSWSKTNLPKHQLAIYLYFFYLEFVLFRIVLIYFCYIVKQKWILNYFAKITAEHISGLNWSIQYKKKKPFLFVCRANNFRPRPKPFAVAR